MSKELYNVALAQDKKSYWVWGPLAFSFFYFLPLIFNLSAFSATRLLGVVAIYVLFILLYAKAMFAKGAKAQPFILAIVILSFSGTYITPGTQALFGYAAFFTGFNFAFKRGVVLLGLILSTVVAAAFTFNYLDVFFLAPALIVSTGMFFIAQAERRDRIHRLKEAKSEEQIEQLATIAERERIARDLHDLVGHSLSSIALNAELAQKLIQAGKAEDAAQYIQQVAQQSRNTLSEVRHAVSGLKQVNLSGQLDKLTKELVNHGYQVNVTNELNTLNAKEESQIILILTELVTNILRHSSGSEVSISLTQDEKPEICVQDNGTVSDFNAGNGLNGIKERCQQIGAQLSVDNSQGFLVRLTFMDNL